MDQNDSGPFGALNASAKDPTYSIKREFAHSTVLLTGASGYLGSLVLENLLRTTDVRKVFVLIRGKRGSPSQERLQRLLHSGLFHLVRDQSKLLAKVELVEGDMGLDDLGLSAADQQKVAAEAQFVIHCAASIELEADVQHTLRSNYMGTQRLLALAGRLRQLRCFLHVSTAYVNVNMPRGSAVDEAIYPLFIGGQEAHHAVIVEDLMSLEPRAANVRAQMYLDLWGFPNTYTMGKNLTEKLVASYHGRGLPVAIVRPSLVCGLSGAPYPGYCGNLAGPIGMGVALAVGLFDCLESVAMVPTHVWDAVPGDVVSSVILAAAAATAAGLELNQYQLRPLNGQERLPLVVHAGTSTTYPISFVEAFYAGLEFVRQNPPPFRLPGGGLFTVPLDYRPNEAAVARCKKWTGWKVWAAVRALELLGQHKTARRLKYGHLAWEIQNSTKTDRNIFFGSRNLLALEERLDSLDADSGDYKVTWTLKNGGWPRYISTNIAGMYRIVFGISEVKGLDNSDFKFIAAKPLLPAKSLVESGRSAAAIIAAAAAPAGATASGPELPDDCTQEQEEQPDAPSDDVVTAGLIGTAAAFSSIPACGSMVLSTDAQLQPGALGDVARKDSSAVSAAYLTPRTSLLSGGIDQNAGGLRAMISQQLGQQLSYKPASLSQVEAGAVGGGMLHQVMSRKLSRRLTPTAAMDKDV